MRHILRVALGVDASSGIAATLLSAQREFRRQFIYLLACTPAFFLLVTIGGYAGSALGVSLGVAVYYGLVTPCFSYAVFRRSGVTAMQLLLIYLRPALAGAVSIAVALAITSATGIRMQTVQIPLISVVMGACYVALIRVLDAEGSRDIVQMAAGVLMRRRAPAPDLVGN